MTERRRILAIDPGERRIGVAAADPRTGVAVPLRAVEAGDDPVEAVARVVAEEGATEVVVGIALSLSGALGPQGQRGQALAEALALRLDVPVRTWDERLSTSEAQRRTAPRMSKRGPARRRPKGDLDAGAAAVILQAYLDSTRNAIR